MKMPITWHKESLNNIKTYELRLRIEIVRAKAVLESCLKDKAMLERQIEKAEAMGIAEFDGQRFGKKGGGGK